MNPPNTMTIKWCPTCGRDDRYVAFTGKSHYTVGTKCPGQPVTLTYKLDESS